MKSFFKKINLDKNIFLFMAVIFSLSYFYKISNLFPFYFIFDMDQITVLDTVLIESNKLPDHYYHTSYGMYLVLVWINRILAILGITHIVTLDTIKNSINPFNEIVYLTELYRLITVGICTSLIYLVSKAFVEVFQVFKRYFFLVLVALTLVPGMIWQAGMIKSEQYSLLFLLISLLLIEKAIKFEKQDLSLKANDYKLNLLIFLSGIFSGLALITKVQSLFLIAILILRFFNSMEDIYRSKKIQILNFILFFVFMIIAHQFIPKNGAAIGAAGYGINIFSLFLFSLILIPFIQTKIPDSFAFFKKGGRYFSFFSCGIIISFFTHFTLFSDFSLGLEYFLLDFKIVFLRILAGDVYLSLEQYLERFLLQLELNPFAVVLLLYNLYLFIKSFKLQRPVFLVSTCLISGMLVHLFIIVRNYNSDHIWFDIGLLFIIIVHRSILNGFSETSNFKILNSNKWDQMVSVVLLFGFFINGVLNYNFRIDNLFGAVSQYGFNRSASLDAVYSENQLIYSRIVNSKIKDIHQKKLFEIHAEQIGDYLKVATGVFRNLKINAGTIAPLYSGLKLNDSETLSIELEESDFSKRSGFLLFPSINDISKRSFLWTKNNDIDQMRILEQISYKKINRDELVVFTRRDLNIYLITDQVILSSDQNPVADCKFGKFTLNNDRLNCYELTRSQIINNFYKSKNFFYVLIK